MAHIEKKDELRRKRKRKEKLGTLKEKLAKTKNAAEQQAIIQKIHRISPLWKPEKAK